MPRQEEWLPEETATLIDVRRDSSTSNIHGATIASV